MGEIRVKNRKLAIAEIIRREKLIRPVSNRNLSLTSPPTNRQINSETSYIRAQCTMLSYERFRAEFFIQRQRVVTKFYFDYRHMKLWRYRSAMKLWRYRVAQSLLPRRENFAS